MRVDELGLAWDYTTHFQLSSVPAVPPGAGVYVLCNIYSEVLYIGQSIDVARRLGEHLEDRRMTGQVKEGRIAEVFVRLVPEHDLLDEEERLLFRFKSVVGRWPSLNRTGP